MPLSAAVEPAEARGHSWREGAAGMNRPAFLQAIIFDFDGVIANSEPLHLRAFQQALGDAGILLTREAYFSRYLGYDDVGVFEAVSQEQDLGWSETRVMELVALKGDKLQQML